MTTRCLLLLAVLLPALCPSTRAYNVYVNSSRGYAAIGGDSIVSNSGSDTLRIAIPLGAGTDDIYLDMTVANRHNVPGKKYKYLSGEGVRGAVAHPGWGIDFRQGDGAKCGFRFEGKSGTDLFGGEHVCHSVIAESPGSKAVILAMPAIFSAASDNRVCVERKGGMLSLRAGRGHTEPVGELVCDDSFRVDTLELNLAPGAELRVSHLVCRHTPAPYAIPAHDIASEREIADRLRHAKDPMAGYWHVTAYTFDNLDTRTGGDYTLAIVPHEDSYMLYYMDGARVNASLWRPGMVKGSLRLTAPGVYEAQWLDAEGRSADHAAVAAIDASGDLTIHFPSRAGASLTLRRMEQYSPIKNPADETDP